MNDLEGEMANRFAHQDKLLANMSQFVTRFQQTLKIFGKDVWASHKQKPLLTHIYETITTHLFI